MCISGLDAQTSAIDLQGGFTLPDKTYFVGEAITATFQVTNKGPSPVCFPVGCDWVSGRHSRFSIRALDSQGQPVPDTLCFERSGNGGGLGRNERLLEGGQHIETLLVNKWCAFTKPGKYRITCKRILNVTRGTVASGQPEGTLPAVPIESALDVTIVEDSTRQNAYFESLLAKPSQDSFELIESLSQARLPEMFPFVLRLLAEDKTQGIGLEDLCYFGADKAVPVLLAQFPKMNPSNRGSVLSHLFEWKIEGIGPLLEEALQSNDAGLREQAVNLCSTHPSVGTTALLLKMVEDHDPLVRRYLGAALGASGDPKAIPPLLKLLHSNVPDPFISIWAAGGLKQLNRADGVPVMIALLKDPKADCKGNVMETLRDITGKDFSDNRSAWLDWWKSSGRREYEK